MWELIQHVSESWLDGALRACDGVRRSRSPIFPVIEDPSPTTPFEVVAEYGKLRLRYYQAEGKAQTTPLLLVYALVKRPFILDFQPERSVVETLTHQGFNLYLTDWIPPTRADTWRGFSAYVHHDLAHAVQYIRDREGVEQISLLGYCLGGLLGAMYSALYPATIKNYISLALPLDMSVRELPASALVDALTPETVALIVKTYGNCPAWLVHANFTAMAPVHHAVGKYIDLYRQRARAGYASTFDLFEHWLQSDVPLAGKLFQELSNDLLQRNLLMRDMFSIGGQTIHLRNITCSILNIIGEHDDVVHPRSSLPFINLLGSNDAHSLIFPAGHMGLAVSNAAHKKLWPQVGRWLKEHSSTFISH